MKPHEIEALRAAVELHLGTALVVHSDYNELSLKLGGKLSASTLKRMWGYNRDCVDFSPKSVDILAQWLKFDSYREFLESTHLTDDNQKQLYAAAKIATLASKTHDGRLVSAYKLFNSGKYRDAMQSLELTDTNIDNLRQGVASFMDYTESMAEELFVKAVSVWGCGYSKVGTIEQIDKIFDQAIPLAQSINNHSQQLRFYLRWANYSFMSSELDKASELYDLAIKHGEISKLEDTGDGGDELLCAINDKAHFLCDIDRAEEALELIEQAIKESGNSYINGYVKLNYAMIASTLNKEIDHVEIYRDILANLELWQSDNVPMIELIQLEALAYYNLGLNYKELLENTDSELAAHYFRKSIAAFGRIEFPSLDYEQNHHSAIAHLAELDALGGDSLRPIEL